LTESHETESWKGGRSSPKSVMNRLYGRRIITQKSASGTLALATNKNNLPDECL